MPLDPQVARYLQAQTEIETTEKPVLTLAEQRDLSLRTALAEAGEPEVV